MVQYAPIDLTWGPRSTAATIDQMDVRVGGAWRFVVRLDDGRETAFRGTYREASARFDELLAAAPAP